MKHNKWDRWTRESAYQCFYNKGFIMVNPDEYKNLYSKVTLVDSYGYYYFNSLSNLLQYHPYKVRKINPYSIKNIEHWCELNDIPFELLPNQEYISNTHKLKWRCLVCGEILEKEWNSMSRNHGCGFCAGQKTGITNCLATNAPELALEWHPVKNQNLSVFDVTSYSNKKVWWKCNICSCEWEASVINRNGINKTGCPKCSLSKGEIRIAQYLDLHNIIYISQKEFDGLIGIGKGNLSYDFYLPQCNLLIEYQGEFHDGSASCQTQKQCEYQQEHDRRKRDYAKANNIDLLEIWYWDFDNIEEILSKALQINKNII